MIEYLPQLQSNEIDDILLSKVQDSRIDLLSARLGDIESVTKSLQGNITTLREVRILFDAVIDKFPETEYRLCADASIVHCVDFGAGIVKLQGGNVTALSREEKNAISIFKLEIDCDNENEEDNLTFAERCDIMRFTPH